MVRGTGSARPGWRLTVPDMWYTLKEMLNQRDPLDLVFQALADPSRRAMVERLCRGPASVSELARPLAMSLPAVVQHLQVLQDSGLVRSEKVGRVRTCQIEPAALRTAEKWIIERRTTWERRLDRLGEDLAGKPEPRNDRSQ
jgi:DNA-binding transcriptional ArsR family regulator